MFAEGLVVLETYGWPAFILGVTVFVLFKYLDKYKTIWISRRAEYIAESEYRAHTELVNHQFFSNIEFEISSGVPSMVFNDGIQPVRQDLFRDVLKYKLMSIRDAVSIIINTDTTNMTPAEWTGFVHKQLNNRNEYFEKYGISGGLPPVVIRKFLVYARTQDTVIHTRVGEFGMSTIFTDNTQRTATLIQLLDAWIVSTYHDARYTLIKLNGEISGGLYKGQVIE
jgi:hypothetical protein